MASLRAKIRHEAEVLQGRTDGRVPVTDLVPGDVVSLRIGALVPADLRLLKVDELECDEGVLTGESMPVAKSVAAVTDHQALDQPGCAFMGTIVHQGSALGVVVQTGARTAFGQIAAGLVREAGSDRLRGGSVAVLAVPVRGGGRADRVHLRHQRGSARPLIEALLFSLAIAVGIAPEMMPAIVTVSLSAGSKALAAKKVLVKRLVAIEDLGNIEILFTDKTGTLTEGVITFERGLDADGQAERRAAPARAGVQRSDGHRRRAGRRQRAGPGPVVRARGGRGTAGVATRRRLREAGRPSLRPRAPAGLGAGQGPRRRAAPDHQGGTRGGAGPVRERPRRRPPGARGTVLRRRPGGGRGHPPRRGHRRARAPRTSRV